MDTPLFLKNKIQRQLNCKGLDYSFKRNKLDKYKQPTDEVIDVVVLKGIYHESNSYITKNVSEAAITQSKKKPMILTLFENVGDLKTDDFVLINDVKYKVTGLLDIQNYGVVCDISLEEVM